MSAFLQSGILPGEDCWIPVSESLRISEGKSMNLALAMHWQQIVAVHADAFCASKAPSQ